MSARPPRGESSRRQLLIAGLAAAGGLALAGGGWWISTSRRERWRAAARGWIDDRYLDSATRLGEEYLATAPAADGTELWRALDERLAPWPSRGLGDAEFRARVRAAIESDFADERVVSVRGYRFAETTVRLCALIALSARTPGAVSNAPVEG